MAELAGKSASIKISGTATAMVGEATTGTGNLTYQVTDTVKQVLDKTATISVHKYSADDAAEAGTTTTNITMTAHGLVTGDLIINETRTNAARIVTYVDADNVTVSAVTSQTTADVIAKYPTEAATAYSLNRLNGTVTYAAALARVIHVSGSYLPMTTATYAHEFSYSRGAELMEVNKFGDDYKTRLAGTKFASGTLSQWDVTSEYYADTLVAGDPVVIEFLYETGADPIRVWALLESVEMQAAIDNPQDNIVSFISTDELLDN